MTKVSNRYFRQHIENHFDDLDFDVSCRKRKQGYAIYWADDGEPLARLQPTGRDDEVEVHFWDDDRWQQVGEFGLVLPLNEALKYVTDDPDDLFFDDDEAEEIPHIVPHLTTDLISALAFRHLHRHIFACAVLGAAAGGVCPGSVGGLAWGAGAGLLFSIGLTVFEGRFRAVLLHTVFVSIPVALVAGVGGTIGGVVSEALGGGLWGGASGLVVGGLCTSLMFTGRLLAWLVAFSAGLTLASKLVGAFELRDHFAGLAIVALVAAIAGKLYSTMAGHYIAAVRPALASLEDATPTDDEAPQD